MRIEIKENGGKAFCRETVNIVSQYRALLKKPARRLHDNFKELWGCMIGCAVLIVPLGALCAAKGANTVRVAAIILLAADVLICAAILVNMNRMLRTLLDDRRTTVLTVDEHGVELDKDGAQTVRVGWENIVFARVFAQTVGLFTKESCGMAIIVSRSYEGELMEGLKQYGGSVPIR